MHHGRSHRSSSTGLVVPTLALVLCLTACNGRTPSAHLEDRVALPAPKTSTAAMTTTPEEPDAAGQPVVLSARSLIGLAFNRQPDIKSSFQAFKAEEARYDFFYTSNDQLTPRISTTNTYGESRTMDADIGDRIGEREREHVIEFGVDKQFFDTTELSIAGGLENSLDDGDFGNQPYAAASVRYPLWESREKLERTSDDIFRKNELNDAQLDYIKSVRSRLQSALVKFYWVVDLRSRVAASARWRDDLQELLATLDAIPGRETAADRRRVEADLTHATSEARNLAGQYEIELARLKNSCGLPYEVPVELDDAYFNPFEGLTHEQLRLVSIETDPEIATLRNSMRNAEVQLDLARRGKWDVALLLSGKSDLRGRGTRASNTDWSVSAGVEVSAVDARVTSSLQRQARASILRFKQAITARESLIYADTLEPLVRIDTLGVSRDQLRGSLQLYEEDYQEGLREYAGGELNIDDLLTRRQTIFNQEVQISSLTSQVGCNIAYLCSATGTFFELLNNHQYPPASASGG
ncbi:MAG: hypothetical protein ABIG44_10840 [Planctomycetota bacterium]